MCIPSSSSSQFPFGSKLVQWSPALDSHTHPTPHTTTHHPTPPPHSPQVLYEDSDLLAVNKPPGVITAPKHRYTGGSMVNRIKGGREGGTAEGGRAGRGPRG